MRTMRTFKVLCILLVWIFTSVVNVQAKTTTIKPNHTLLQAMARIGCSPNWLASVMRESPIDESQLNDLDPNQKVVSPNDCRGPVSREDILLTKGILQRQNQGIKVKARVAEAIGKQIQDLRDLLDQLNQKHIEDGVLIAKLQKDFAKQVRLLAEKDRNFRWQIGGVVILSALFWISLYWLWLRLTAVVSPRKIVKRKGSHFLTCLLVTPKYLVEGKGDEVRGDRLDTHIAKAYPHIGFNVHDHVTPPGPQVQVV